MSKQATGIGSRESGKIAFDNGAFYYPACPPPYYRAATIEEFDKTKYAGNEGGGAAAAAVVVAPQGHSIMTTMKNKNKKRKFHGAAYYYGLLLVALVTFREVNRNMILPPASSSFSSSALLKRGHVEVRASHAASDADASITTIEEGVGQHPPEEELEKEEEEPARDNDDADASASTMEEGVGQHLEPEEEEEEEPARDDDEAKCSCYDRDDANATCCQRAVVSTHKFGWILTRTLFKPVPGVRREWMQSKAFPNSNDTIMDYRHVAIVRNYPEAFVSGYLYHRSGRECWLDLNGVPAKVAENFDWERDIRQSPYHVGPYPARNNRSICQFLADESVEDGMRVYMAVALNKWYRGINEYYRIVHDNTDRENRTLFLCMGDYPDPTSQEHMFRVAMDWLFPGNMTRRDNVTKLPLGAINKSPDRNGHASPGNATQRLQLLELVHQLDQEVFNGTVAATNARIGCRGTIHRTTSR